MVPNLVAPADGVFAYNSRISVPTKKKTWGLGGLENVWLSWDIELSD